MSATARGYGGVVGRRAIYTPEEAYARRLEGERARYRRRRDAQPATNEAHRCTACDQAGHNVRTCRNCVRCGQPAKWSTSLGRFCQACLGQVAR